MVKKCIASVSVFCFFLLFYGCITSRPEVTQEPLRFQAILDRFSLSLPQQTMTIEVPYTDYDGIAQRGRVESPPQYKDSIITFFNKLYEKKFRFANVTPVSSFEGNIERALSSNATFALIQTNGPEQAHLVLMINPVTNPTIVKTSHVIKENPYNLAVWPAQGVFSVRHAGKEPDVRSGIITKEIRDILTQQNIIRIGDSRDDIITFGLFIFNPSESAMLKKSASEADSVLNPDQDPNIRMQKNLRDAFQSREDFSCGPLSDKMKKELIDAGVWSPGCPLSLDRLSLVCYKHYDSQGEIKAGILVTADVAAQGMMGLLKELFEERYPINLLSSFNCRPVTGGGHYSLHSYGMAVDFNYDTNPYVGSYQVSQDRLYAGASLVPSYVNLATLDHSSYQPDFNEKLILKMRQIGFYQWGGDWYTPTDYMHFQSSTFIAEMLPMLDAASGKKLFSLGAQLSPAAVNKLSNIALWSELYQAYPDQFADVVVSQSQHLEEVADEYGFFEIILNKLSGKTVFSEKGHS